MQSAGAIPAGLSALIGRTMPRVLLPATDGKLVDMSRIDGLNVIYCFPRTSPADGQTLPGWDTIAGARGCTPQSCGYRDRYRDLQNAGADRIIGISTQTTEYQREARVRLHLPFHLLSDADLALAQALGLPTFKAGGLTLLQRLTLVLKDGRIIFAAAPADPSQDAGAMLHILQGQGYH